MAKMGRPKMPTSKVTKWALWKRAQRSVKPGAGKGFQRHHVDGQYGRKSSKVILMTIGQHNAQRKGTKYKKRK